MILIVNVISVGALASEGFEDLVTLAKSGATEEVFTEFIKKSPIQYKLAPAEVTMLFDLGVSESVLALLSSSSKSADSSNATTGSHAFLTDATHSSGNDASDNFDSTDDDPIVQTAAGDNADISYFYDVLMPYGSWIHIDDVWYWRPTCAVMDIHWRPYCHHGHWIWTDWGWCWESDYSWGWAPFHYGRWWRHPGYGWVWLPDNYWGPAWVHWRQYGSYYGWAPLPPHSGYHAGIGFYYQGKHIDASFNFGLSGHHYVFVDGAHFSDHNWRDHRVHHTEAVNYFDGSTIIQTGYEHRKDHFVNHGPGVDSISKTTGRPIQQYKLADTAYRKGERIPNPAITGNNYSVYRPNIADKTRQTPTALEAQRDAVKQNRELQRQEKQIREQQQKAESSISEKRNQYRAAESTAQQRRAEYDSVKREQERLEKSAKSESDSEQRRKISEAAALQRQQAAEARRQQREAERQADSTRKAFEDTQRQVARQQSEASKQRESTQQRQQSALQDALRQSQRQYLQQQRTQSEYSAPEQPSRVPSAPSRMPPSRGSRGR